jgi:hypothetical protein
MLEIFLIHSATIIRKFDSAYDKQEDIYNALLLSVDTGTANVLSNGGFNPATADVIYGGSSTKCFEASLKLRLLNHLSLRRPGLL